MGVDLVALEGAAQEEGAAAPEQRAKGEEREVRAGRYVGGHHAVVEQQVGHDQVVHVAAMRRHQHHRGLPPRFPDGVEQILIYRDPPEDPVEDRREERGDALDVALPRVRSDLGDVGPGPTPADLPGEPGFLCDGIEARQELRVGEDLVPGPGRPLLHRAPGDFQLSVDPLVKHPPDLVGYVLVGRLGALLGQDLVQTHRGRGEEPRVGGVAYQGHEAPGARCAGMPQDQVEEVPGIALDPHAP